MHGQLARRVRRAEPRTGRSERRVPRSASTLLGSHRRRQNSIHIGSNTAWRPTAGRSRHLNVELVRTAVGALDHHRSAPEGPGTHNHRVNACAGTVGRIESLCRKAGLVDSLEDNRAHGTRDRPPAQCVRAPHDQGVRGDATRSDPARVARRPSVRLRARACPGSRGGRGSLRPCALGSGRCSCGRACAMRHR